jgi:hypothetical protein
MEAPDMAARVQALEREVFAVTERQKHSPTWAWLTTALGAAAVIIVGGAWAFVRPAAAEARAEVVAVRRETAAEIRVMRSDVTQRLDTQDRKQEVQDRKVDAVYQVIVEGRPRAEARVEAGR